MQIAAVRALPLGGSGEVWEGGEGEVSNLADQVWAFGSA